jgi:beta-galactosidase
VTGPVTAPNGTFGPMFADAVIEPHVDVASTSPTAMSVNVSCYVIAPDGVTVVGSSSEIVSLGAGGWARVALPPIPVLNASLWFPAPTPESPDRPLYGLVTTVWDGGAIADAQNISLGIRSAVFNASSGLWINGFPVKIRGMSIHQDFGPTGTSLPPNVHAFRVQRLLDMGGNGW